jgi:hypothetical protein
MRSRWIETSTRTGPAVKQDRLTVTLQSWSLSTAWPGGGWVWNHPRAVIVDRAGTQERIPIYNVPLLIQSALLVLVLLVALSFALNSIARRK